MYAYTHPHKHTPKNTEQRAMKHAHPNSSVPAVFYHNIVVLLLSKTTRRLSDRKRK